MKNQREKGEEEDELGTLGTADCTVSKLANISRVRSWPSLFRGYTAILYLQYRKAALFLFHFSPFFFFSRAVARC